MGRGAFPGGTRTLVLPNLQPGGGPTADPPKIQSISANAGMNRKDTQAMLDLAQSGSPTAEHTSEEISEVRSGEGEGADDGNRKVAEGNVCRQRPTGGNVGRREILRQRLRLTVDSESRQRCRCARQFTKADKCLPDGWLREGRESVDGISHCGGDSRYVGGGRQSDLNPCGRGGGAEGGITRILRDNRAGGNSKLPRVCSEADSLWACARGKVGGAKVSPLRRLR